jgi:type VI secretion system secreted protein VgrG
MPTSSFTQENRFLELTTPLGKNVLLLNSFSISEKVSALYTMELDALYKGTVDPNRLLGQPITITVRMGDLEGTARYFHGIVNEVQIGDETERFRRFRLVVVPNLWLLTLTKNFKVFESMTVVDIVRQILSQAGIQNRFELTGDYTQRDHCVQFRETNFDFISRLMEEEGIFYYFEHSNGKHVMVVADAPTAFKTCPGQPSANYGPELGAQGLDWVMAWGENHALRSGSYKLYDFHFEKSKSLFQPQVSTVEPVAGNTSYTIADVPGRFTHQFNKIDSSSGCQEEGLKFARLRMEQVETHNPMFRAVSNCRNFSPGQKFTLNGSDKPGEYSITAVEHVGMQYPPYLSGMESSILYSNTLTCIPFGAKFRPENLAERPVIVGPQTATVIDGPDKYSRVKVKFHWGDELSSAWVRVAQRWCGPNWGTIYIPRVGHEVIVEFLNGDPDQPMIIGSMYNAQNMPPYTLPDNKTQCGIKTRSMSGSGSDGGSDEFNELRFEDKQGSEDIYFHAQKDFHRVVEHDDDLKVGNDQTIEIKNNRTEVVKNGNEKVTIETGKREIFVNTGNDLHQVKTGNRDAIIDMGNDSITVKMGNHIRKITLGKSETEAMQSITLKVGANKIVVDQSGITLDGIMITLKGKAMIQSQAPMQKMNGDAMVMIKGGITMIN